MAVSFKEGFKNGFQGLGKEHGFRNRVNLMNNSLKSRYCSISNKGAIAALAAPKALATTFVAGPMVGAAMLVDRFASVIKTLGNPRVSVVRKILKVVLLPVKLAFTAVGVGVGLLFTPIKFLASTIHGLAMMNPAIRKNAAVACAAERAKLLQAMNKA